MEKPEYFEDLPEHFGAAHSIAAYRAVQRFGRAVRLNWKNEIPKRREYFEKLFLGRGHGSVRYEVVGRADDVIKVWKTGKYGNELVYGSYEFKY